MATLRDRLARLVALIALGVACSKDDGSRTDEDTRPSAATSTSDRSPDLSNRSFPLLVWAAHNVDEDYFDKTRIAPRDQLVYAMTVLGLHTPEFFARVDAQRDVLHVEVRAARETFSLGGVDSLMSAADRLEEILEFTQRILDLEPEPLRELEYAAINGLFAPLDPHTTLLTPEEHADLGVRTKGEFGGIGAQIRAEGRRIIILKVLPGMPAELVGIEAGDVILEIDGSRTVNMTAPEAQRLLRGPVGTVVKLKLRRGRQTMTANIERNVIKIDSVALEMLPQQIAYVHIANFQENTSEQVRELLHEHGLAKGAVKGLVLDLRGNSGGLLSQATEVLDQFVTRGDLVIVRSAMGREVDPASAEVVLPDDVSVVVLIDEQSASASEIVSGGVQALGRGVVLGRSSFGKGTVQMVRPASPYGRPLALKLTIAEYLVAGDHRIQTLGVMPDLQLFPVELSNIPGIVRYYDRERFERERERSRTANLPSAAHERHLLETIPSKAELHYLSSDVVPPSFVDAFGAGDELPRPMRDPEVRIAQQVAIALLGARNAKDRVEAMSGAVRTMSQTEDTRIVEALAGMKIDWSAGTTDAPKLAMTASLASTQAIPAGEPFTLHVEVKNEGPTRIHRVHVVTDCVHDELDGIEMMLGAIDPGQTAARDVNLHVMPWHSDFIERIHLDAYAGDPEDTPHARTSVLFEVAGAPRPMLSYDYWLVDDPALVDAAPKRPTGESIPGEPPFQVQGNADGVLQPGEKVLLAFSVRNEGAGKSPDVRAILRNSSGKQGLLEEGLVPLGELASGQTKTGAFGITVADDADPSLPFEVELMVGDTVRRTSVQHKLRFRLHPSGASFADEARRYKVEDEPVRLYAGAHPSSRVVTEVAVGTELATLGTMGSWRVVSGEHIGQRGRRLFVPNDLAALTPVESASGRPAATETLAYRPAVLPPAIEVDPHPRVTSANQIELSGVVTHPERVRDVVVLVRPPGPAQIDRKVHYAASKGVDRLTFQADIPLEPGGNRVIILARDGAKVEQRRDVWVYRDQAP